MSQFINYTITVRKQGEIVPQIEGCESSRGQVDGDLLEDIRYLLPSLDSRKCRDDFVFLGKKLFKALLEPVKISFEGELWKSRIRNSETNSVRLRIVFEEVDNLTDLASQIINLPWEFLCYPDDNNTFLGTDPRVALSCGYQTWLNNPLEGYAVRESPLRVLFVHGHPSQLRAVGFTSLVPQILTGLGDAVEVKELKNPTPHELSEALSQKPHVLHFLGHGKPGALALSDGPDGEPCWLADKSLSDFLRAGGVKLAVLQACEGGSPSEELAFTGTAAQLVKTHIPAVIAIRYPISQSLAWNFVKTLYNKLAAGEPVDVAVQAGRRALATGAESHASRDFGAPVLWMRLRDGLLFSPDERIPEGKDEKEPQPFPKTNEHQLPEVSQFFNALNEQSKAARKALNPIILERIDREVVSKKYLPAIERGVSGKLERTIPLIAPAGYGKSTILGQIYDHLSQSAKNWVGLILCSQLILESVPLSIALGIALFQTEKPVTEIAGQLNRAYGRGVIIIDTLDLIISPRIVKELEPILRTLMQQGTTVVLTCRDHEYSELGKGDRFASIREQIDHHYVPEFNPSEIRQAAIQFFTHHLRTTKQKGAEFAEAILNLSADSRSLKEIVQNPLLLALLCELFGEEGNVPPDLTISKLYNTYWQKKVAYSRVHESSTCKLAIAKEKFCLTIAQSMFERSTTYLVESFYVDELPIELTDSTTDAYNDLLSENVLDILPSKRIHFFHQTLLEYAIAYWLTRYYAQAQRQGWLTQLASTDDLWQQSHWYPILRQHLTLVEPESAFTEIANQLGTKNLGTFGAIAYAAAAREQPDALNHLLPLALTLGDAYQKRLQKALTSASKRLIFQIWDTLLHLLTAGNHTAAVNTAKTLSQSIARWWEVLGERLPEAMNALADRASTLNNGQDDRVLIMGWLLQDCLPRVAEQPSQSILAALREHYFLMGHRTSEPILQIHQHLTVPRTDQAELLNTLLQREIPDDRLLESAIVTFAADFFKPLETSDWLAFLDRASPKRWSGIQAKVVGKLAAACPDTLQILLARALVDPKQAGEQLSSTFAALEAAVIADATQPVTNFFTGLDLSSLLPTTRKSLLGFLYRIVPLLSAPQQDTIARWLQAGIPDDLQETIVPLLDRLADQSLIARQLLESSLECLPPALQTKQSLRLLRFQPIAQHPPFDTLDKDTQIFLIQHYRTLDEPEAVERLLQACQIKRKDVALAASKDWDERQLKYLDIPRVIPLLAATYPGIQERTLNWITQLWRQRGQLLDATTLSQICQTITYAANPAIARLLCELVATWVKEHRQVPVGVAEVLGLSLEAMIQQKKFDGAPGEPMIQALKAIAQSEDANLDTEKLYSWVCQLLTSVSLVKIPHSEPEAIDLLSALVRLKASYLHRLFNELPPILVEKEWLRNLSAIFKTVRRVEGVESSLFKQVPKASWYNEFVQSLLLDVLGL